MSDTNPNEPSQTFVGFQLFQHWDDFLIWEAFFRRFPVRTMIELGTGTGGTTVYFALQAYQRHMYFHTFDNQKWIDFGQELPKILKLESLFHHVDLFSPEGKEQVASIIRSFPHPVAIFFDDGDKPKEWSIFAPMTSPGDFLIVHDWGTEFKQKDIGNVKVERILTKECNRQQKRDAWKAVWFKRI